MLAPIFSAFSYKITFIRSSLLNVVWLQKFRNIIKISSTVLPVRPVEYLQVSKKICFIGNNEHISDKNVYNEVDIRQSEIDGVNQRLTEWSKYYESDKSIWFFKACYRFNIFSNK